MMKYIDRSIQECQKRAIAPYCVIEWIEYDQFKNIKVFARGAWATIYTAIWKDGGYGEWNSETQKLERREDIRLF